MEFNHLNKTEVRGYLKPTSVFKSLGEWKSVAARLIELQSVGIDTRGGEISCKNPKFCSVDQFDEFVSILSEYFGFLLKSEVDRWDLLTRKNVLDFIEDFVNHRVWGLEREFGHYFKDINSLRFAYFYSRGDIEPYVLLDEQYTVQTLGALNETTPLLHYTSPKGLKRMQSAISSGHRFDISSFTRSQRPFFREDSTLIVRFVGKVSAAFKSDVKSMATDKGYRACNLYRLQYPGDDTDNICRGLWPEDCEDEIVLTSLWNEIIATPLEIISVHKSPKDSGVSLR